MKSKQLLLFCVAILLPKRLQNFFFHLFMNSELNSLKLFCQVMLRYIEISIHIVCLYIYIFFGGGPKVNTMENH